MNVPFLMLGNLVDGRDQTVRVTTRQVNGICDAWTRFFFGHNPVHDCIDRVEFAWFNLRQCLNIVDFAIDANTNKSRLSYLRQYILVRPATSSDHGSENHQACA